MVNLFELYNVVLSRKTFFLFRFVPDKDFAGTDRTRKRDGPVQFEKFGEEDLSELDKFFLDAKRGGKRSEPVDRYKCS